MSAHEERARLAAIGVHGFATQTFLAALREARISLVLDVRQRRGVRESTLPGGGRRAFSARCNAPVCPLSTTLAAPLDRRSREPSVQNLERSFTDRNGCRDRRHPWVTANTF
jgi:hypothetical protein